MKKTKIFFPLPLHFWNNIKNEKNQAWNFFKFFLLHFWNNIKNEKNQASNFFFI